MVLLSLDWAWDRQARAEFTMRPCRRLIILLSWMKPTTEEKRSGTLVGGFLQRTTANRMLTSSPTADKYGASEDVLGKWFAANPDKRENIFLSIKFGIILTPGQSPPFKVAPPRVLQGSHRSLTPPSQSTLRQRLLRPPSGQGHPDRKDHGSHG